MARDALVAVLRQDALNVRMVIQGMPPAVALETLLSPGFDAVSTNRAQLALALPRAYGIESDGTGRSRLRLLPVANARNYEAQYKTGTGD